MEQVAVAAERVGSAAGAAGGLWLWLAENQQQIAAICTLASLGIAAAGFGVHWYYLHRGAKEKFGRRKNDLK